MTILRTILSYSPRFVYFGINAQDELMKLKLSKCCTSCTLAKYWHNFTPLTISKTKTKGNGASTEESHLHICWEDTTNSWDALPQRCYRKCSHVWSRERGPAAFIACKNAQVYMTVWLQAWDCCHLVKQLNFVFATNCKKMYNLPSLRFIEVSTVRLFLPNGPLVAICL